VVQAFSILAITGVPGARDFRVTGWLTRFWQFWQSVLDPRSSAQIRGKVFAFPITAIPPITVIPHDAAIPFSITRSPDRGDHPIRSALIFPSVFLCVLCGKRVGLP